MHTCRPIARWGQRPVDRADNWTPEWEGFLCRENRLRTRLQQLSLPLSLGPWPLPHPPSEGKAPGPGSTDLRQTFHGFLELHRLLVMGTEELDGIGQSHGEIWVHRGIMGLVWSCPWKAPPSHYPQTILSCPTLEVGLRRRRWSGPPTCPGVRYIVLQLQEDKKGGHGKGQVALAMQAQMVVACWAGRDGR